ncbi:MAG: hypothetical protein GXP62_08510 [Oligoflexia bacterium]|nr:hypothetical protein [Oligoflexia bacterium]
MLARTTLFLLTACAPKQPPAGLPEDTLPSVDSAPSPADPALPGVRIEARWDVDDGGGSVGGGSVGGIVCTATGCQALAEGVLQTFDPRTLAHEPGSPLPWGDRLLAAPGPTVTGPCPDQPKIRCAASLDAVLAGEAPLALAPDHDPPRDAADLATAWNVARSDGGRVGFAARAPAPAGGAMVLVRGSDGTRVMQSGAGVRFMDLPDPAEPGQAAHVQAAHGQAQAAPGEAQPATGAAYLRALALHPTGQEAYALAFPGTSLLAFDPVGLRPRWRLPLHPQAHGLFIEHDGRLLVVEEGGQPDPDRLLDTGTQDPSLPENARPYSDLAIELMDRPDATSTALVDLAQRRLVWREPGRYRSLLALDDGAFLLATDRAILRLVLPAPPSAAAP